MRTEYYDGQVVLKDSIFEDYEYVLEHMADGYKPDFAYNESCTPDVFKEKTWKDLYRKAFENSVISKTAFIDGRPMFIFALVKVNEDFITFHNLSTQESVSKSLLILKASKKIMEEILNHPDVSDIPVLTLFRPDNNVGLRWAKLIGGKELGVEYNGFKIIDWRGGE